MPAFVPRLSTLNMSLAENCAACSLAITKRHYSILCFSCDQWNHIKCVDLSVAQLKNYESELKKSQGDRWNCPSCLRAEVQKSQANRKSLSPMQPEHNPGTVTLLDIMNKLDRMELESRELVRMYNEQLVINNKLQSEIDNVNTRMLAVENELKKRNGLSGTDQSEEFYQEYCDREQRKSNIIIFGHPEPTSGEENGMESAGSIIQSVCPAFDLSSILHVSRLGRTQNSASRPRPLKVCCKDSGTVVGVLKQCYKIGSNPRLKHLTVASDKTPKQIQFYKSVKEQLMQRISAGDANLRIKHIRGIPTIVKVNNAVPEN